MHPDLDPNDLTNLIHRINSCLPFDCGHNQQTGYVTELFETHTAIYNSLTQFIQTLTSYANNMSDTIYQSTLSQLPHLTANQHHSVSNAYNNDYDTFIPNPSLPAIFHNQANNTDNIHNTTVGTNNSNLPTTTNNTNNNSSHQLNKLSNRRLRKRSKSNYLAKKLASSKRYDSELIQLINSVLKLRQLIRYSQSELTSLTNMLVGKLNPHTKRYLDMTQKNDISKATAQSATEHRSNTAKNQDFPHIIDRSWPNKHLR